MWQYLKPCLRKAKRQWLSPAVVTALLQLYFFMLRPWIQVISPLYFVACLRTWLSSYFSNRNCGFLFCMLKKRTAILIDNLDMELNSVAKSLSGLASDPYLNILITLERPLARNNCNLFYCHTWVIIEKGIFLLKIFFRNMKYWDYFWNIFIPKVSFFRSILFNSDIKKVFRGGLFVEGTDVEHHFCRGKVIHKKNAQYPMKDPNLWT